MIGEGFYNSSVDCILSHVSFLCQEEINLAPVNILVGAMAHHGGGEGLWRCFLPDCPGCIVYQLSTDNLSGSDRAEGGTAGETWEVKATPVRVDATWKDNLTCMDLRWEDIVELLHDSSGRNSSQSKHCNQTELQTLTPNSMMEQNLSFISADGWLLRRLQNTNDF